jgi:hypothetical protein
MTTPASVLLAALALVGCGHALPTRAPAHGNLVAHANGQDDRSERQRAAAAPLVVLVEDARVRAIDPRNARTQWVLPLEVTGHGVANATTVYFPVRGHRLVAVDRVHGTVKFSVDLPGEALTGLAVSERWIAATVVGGHRGARAELVALAAHDGHIRWRHRSSTILGIPAVHGGIAVVPSGAQVAAFRMSTGRELARQDVPHGERLERVVHHRDAWFVGGGAQWVELGQGGRTHELAGAQAPVFPRVSGIDPGHDDGERLRLWLALSEHAIARDAVLLARRAVIALRLDPDGKPRSARWVHLERSSEIVAMEVLGDRVVLVREDGAIVTLDAATGVQRDRIAGGDPVRGALVLDAASVRRDGTPKHGPAHADLLAVLADPDPRLLPAQRLAADLLWRDDDPKVRETVVALADGEIRSESSDAAGALRDHAATLLHDRWGQGTASDAAQVLARLRERPRAGGTTESLASAIREAAHTGTPEVIEQLAALLLHPGTRPIELVEIVETLAKLRDPAAVDAVATFVRRYHADQVVAYESTALRAAAELLLEHAATAARDDDSIAAAASDRALTALSAVADDPLCEPVLRAFIAHGLRQLADESADERQSPGQRPPLLSTRL